MADRFDVIVVGARCAGSPLAVLLARAGLRVCLVDRSRFPSDSPSTHAVQPSGVKILDRLGVLGALLEVTPAIEHATIAFDDARIEIDDFSAQGGAPMLSARRVTLDSILLEAAATAGAEIRTQTAITGLVEDHGRVAGVTTRSGELRAPLVVGADGIRSSVARLTGAAEYHRTPAGRMFTWAYFEGAQADEHMWLGALGDCGYLGYPTDAGLFMAAVVPSIEHRDEVLADRGAAHAARLSHWPELEAVLGGAERVGPVRVMARDGFFRESAGPGWVLLGDAGHFKDPSPGQGISDALRQAVELAPAIERALGAGPVEADRILRDWWRWRDEDAWEMYWFAHDMGAAGPPPLLVQEIQRRIAADPKRTEALMRVLNHDLPPSEAFTPGLALSAAGRALLTRPGQRRTLVRELGTLIANKRHRRAPSAPSPAAP